MVLMTESFVHALSECTQDWVMLRIAQSLPRGPLCLPLASVHFQPALLPLPSSCPLFISWFITRAGLAGSATGWQLSHGAHD